MAEMPELPRLQQLREEETRLNRQAIDFVRRWLLSEEGEVFCYAHKDRPGLPYPVTHTPDMCGLAVVAGDLYYQLRSEEDLDFAVSLIDRTIGFYRSPAGSFHQKYAEPWCGEDIYRSAPWANAFFGHHILNAYVFLQNEIDIHRRTRWQGALEDLGRWIYGNPSLGTLVFNCSLDLATLLWRLGRLTERQEWIDWARTSLHALLDRNVSANGLNMGEAGGCSGNYQALASRMLAWHVWKVPEDTRSLEVLGRMWSANRKMASARAEIPANYGTRGSSVKSADLDVPLVLGARGDAQALGWVATHWRSYPDTAIRPHHSVLHNQGDGAQIRRSLCALSLVRVCNPLLLEVWQQALRTRPEPPAALEPIERLEEIDYTIVRRGPWQLWLTGYEKNIWSRGLSAIAHRDFPGLLASVLNSLPSESINTQRYDVGSGEDWAAFPHVKLTADSRTYHSQRVLKDLQVRQEAERVEIELVEILQDARGNEGPACTICYVVEGEKLTVDVCLEGASGEVSLDFHVRKHPMSHLAFWTDEQVQAMRDGQLPESGGSWAGQTFASEDCPELAAIEIDNSLVEFALGELPKDTVVSFGSPIVKDLHAGNFGGTRMSLHAGIDQQGSFSVKVTCRKPAMKI